MISDAQPTADHFARRTGAARERQLATNWQSGDAAGDGVRIHYTRTGGRKPPLVMLHGVTDSGQCWARVAEALAADYDCLMLDSRGHGLSEAPETGYTAEDHARDVATVIKALGLGRPAVMGQLHGRGDGGGDRSQLPR